MSVKKRPVSPRQKMINLMYIVLLAMLALNVSNEVLKGFDLVGRSLLCAGAVLAASVARAEGDEPAEYVKDVPAGTSAELTADEVAAAAGMTFVKTGGGTLVVKDEMADFAGDIRIREGYYEVWTSGALGTADGAAIAARRSVSTCSAVSFSAV